ncbi:hypothetical protein DNTS_034685 [Danionella cerebrum]|uniref:Uncharacterized protein n=1 Tax=Danionella cerebrum TaxID=2873325 RepID=A0A553MY89_9TELE|nr:hypothetical protein DNTS_034685 [Danionella translucida]
MATQSFELLPSGLAHTDSGLETLLKAILVKWSQLLRTGSVTLKFKDKNVHVFPDFPPEIAKKRAAYYDVKRLLRPRSDVKYGLRGLTGFRITYNNSEHIFDSPAEAMAFVKHRIIPD